MGDNLTENDIKKIQEEINYRKLVVRPEAIEAVKEARAQGDLSENFEYYAAKRDKNKNESRIRYLERMIKNANIVSDESAEYMSELAHEIDLKMAEILRGARVSTTQAAVLVALQYADEAKKNSGTTDNLRLQLKEYLEDAAKAKSERDFYKRELDRIKAISTVEDKTGGLWR